MLYIIYLLYMITCVLLSATSTNFKWALTLYCWYCPRFNTVFLLFLLLFIKWCLTLEWKTIVHLQLFSPTLPRFIIDICMQTSHISRTSSGHIHIYVIDRDQQHVFTINYTVENIFTIVLNIIYACDKLKKTLRVHIYLYTYIVLFKLYSISDINQRMI